MEFLKDYLALGWELFPCHSIVDGRCTCSKGKNCQSPGKHPRVQNGVKDASKDPAVIDNWARTWPETNWGLACGSQSGVVVIDVDVKGSTNGFEALEEFEMNLGPLPKTLQATTGSGGRHIFFAYDGDDIKNKVGWLKGVDVRSDGGYVILAPGTHVSGGSYRWDNFQDAGLTPLPDFVRTSLLSSKAKNMTGDWNGTGKRMTIQEMIEHGIPEGFRDRWLFEEACNLRTDNLRLPDEGRAVVETLILAAAAKSNFPAEEAMKCVEQAYKQDRTEHHATLAKAKDGVGAENAFHPLTDIGNRDRFLDLYGDDLRYVEAWGWFTWSDRGWTPVSTLWVKNKIEEVADKLREEIEVIFDNNDIKEYAAWIKASESMARIDAVERAARQAPGLLRETDDFDKNPHELACLNGMVDLVNGQIRPFSRTDLVTKNTGVNYNPSAPGTLWRNFLEVSTQGDKELQEYLQMAAGYTLTGSTGLDSFFIISGPPASGKSSFMDALMEAMGTYAATIPAQLIMYQNNRNPSEYDLARLPGLRLASVSEIREGGNFDDAVVKGMTGGDSITAREIYGKPFQFKPKFKLWIATNHDPMTSDDGMGRRLKRIGFRHSVDEADRDPNLKEALRTTEREAVLAWMVEGAMKFLAIGRLNEPATVKADIEKYKASQDIFQMFLDDLVVSSPNGQTGLIDMFRTWSDWCKAMNQFPGKIPGFKEKLLTKGYQVERPAGGSEVVTGVAVKVAAMPSLPWA